MKNKLTKKDLINTKWHIKIEESRVLQETALELGFKMTSCYVGLFDEYKDILEKKTFNPKTNKYRYKKPPVNCHILYFEKDTFSGCNIGDKWDLDYKDYKEMKFEDWAELKKRLILEKIK